MPPMPCVEGQVFIERIDAALWMIERAREVRGPHGPQQRYQPCMHGFQEIERGVYVEFLRVGRRGPKILIVRFNGWLLFRERQFEPDERIHVAVREVMDNLPHRPSSMAIGSVELLLAQPLHSFAKPSGRFFNLSDELAPLCLRRRTGPLKLADGV